MTNLVIGFIAGGVLCFIIGWLLGSRRRPIAPADNRLEEELRQQVAQRELTNKINISLLSWSVFL